MVHHRWRKGVIRDVGKGGGGGTEGDAPGIHLTWGLPLFRSCRSGKQNTPA